LRVTKRKADACIYVEHQAPREVSDLLGAGGLLRRGAALPHLRREREEVRAHVDHAHHRGLFAVGATHVLIQHILYLLRAVHDVSGGVGVGAVDHYVLAVE